MLKLGAYFSLFNLFNYTAVLCAVCAAVLAIYIFYLSDFVQMFQLKISVYIYLDEAGLVFDHNLSSH